MGTPPLPDEWAGEIFSADGRWVGTLACETGDMMLQCLEYATFGGYRISGVHRRPVRPVGPVRLVINGTGPAGRAIAERALQIFNAEA